MYTKTQSYFLFQCLLMAGLLLLTGACKKSESDPDPNTNPPATSTVCTDPTEFIFEESEGLLIIESENAVMPTGWVAHKSVADFTGTGYIQWEGNNNFGKTGDGLISYKIRIKTAGTYRIQWRSRINEGTSSSESNDAWLRFPGAADFFGKKSSNNSIVYPKGSGKTPNPKGSGADGWFKVYMNKLGEWSWQARTSDHDAHDIFVTFDKAGDYILEVSGRSKGFAIDRIALYKDDTVDTSKATDATEKESNIVCK